MFLGEMKVLAIIAAAHMMGAWAGEPDQIRQRPQDYNMGIFARQGILQEEPEQPTNLNTFKEALGNAPAPEIILSDEPSQPYEIRGEKVSDFSTAIDKACDFQKNDCADLANTEPRPTFTVQDCDKQSDLCKSTLKNATQKKFLSVVTMAGIDDFEFLCETGKIGGGED